MLISYLLKRKFINDVEFAIACCYERAAEGAPSVGEFSLSKPKMMLLIDEWLAKERTYLNLIEYTSPSQVGDAVNRARMWVGLHLVNGAFEYGDPSIPRRSLKCFYKPANVVAQDYFGKLRMRTRNPFSSAFDETFDNALQMR